VLGKGFPIIILHGLSIDHRAMAGPLEPVFKDREGWKRIYLDLPGMGETPGLDWITNQEQVLDIVLHFIESVIPGQRFAVAGYSYGGYLARGVIRRR
jgi:pimeloyl-ACP methyl ester carboxylesterase